MVTSRLSANMVFVLLAAGAGSVFAAGAGQVQNLSGVLSVQRDDGSVRILSQKSEVNSGEVLTTQKDSYAQINFTDGSSMTMRPNTQMKIEAFQFDEGRPQADNAFFRLLKGGLRTVTGLVGKRGNQDSYRIGTATATIGIRGSSGESLECSSGCEGVFAGGEKIPRGVYHKTYVGSYIVQTASGDQIVGEGELGFVKDDKTPPQLLPGDNIDLSKLGDFMGLAKAGDSCTF